MKKNRVFVAIEVVYDHYRFEEFIGAYSSRKKAINEIRLLNRMYPIRHEQDKNDDCVLITRESVV